MLNIRVTEVPQDGFVIPIERQHKGLCPGAKVDVYFPGFPTLKHLKHQVKCAAECARYLFEIMIIITRSMQRLQAPPRLLSSP